MSVTKLNQLNTRVGFIGLGLMGSRLDAAPAFIRMEYSSMEPQSKAGDEINKGGSPLHRPSRTSSAHSDVILSSLANDAAVRSVYLDNGGVFSSAEAGNGHPRNEHDLAGTFAPDLHRGGSHRKASTFSMWPSLDRHRRSMPERSHCSPAAIKDTFEQCVPLFESIARQWFLIGPGSSGVQMKLVVNLLLGLDMQAIAEAVSLGEHLQIDRNVLLDVLSKTAVIAPAMVGKFRKIKDGDYSPEFPLRLMSKDMDLVMDAARTSGADLPAASAAQRVLTSSLASSGDLDLSAITPFVVEGRLATK